MKDTLVMLIVFLTLGSTNVFSQDVRMTDDRISYFIGTQENGFLNFSGALSTMELKSGTGQDMLISSGTDGVVRFRTNGTTRLQIDAQGGVGVGNFLSPPAGYKFAVDGKVICEDLFVELSTDWPDYVFQPDYELMPIEDLATYLRQHHHLPGIMSALEMEEGGRQDVGQMQRQLLEKIEELTLYIVDLHEENGRLSREIESIKELLEIEKTGRNEE
jgi:hypothetical protein